MPIGLSVAFWAAMGMAVGSFLNVAADRLPNAESLFSPPSHCAACCRRLKPVEMVPVWSYLALRGRCRTCGAPIGVRTLVVELGSGLLFALAAWKIAPNGLPEWAVLILTSAYLAVLVVVSVTDLEHGLVLRRVTVPAIGLGLVASLLTGWPGLLYHLAGGLIGAGVIVLIVTLVPGGMGWGDAWLAGFVGLVSGLPGVWFALFVGFVCGGIVGAWLLASGRRQRGDTVPLGPFLALGGIAALLFGEEMMHAFRRLAALMG